MPGPKSALLLSIRPKHAEKIFDGIKTVELRRIRPRLQRGDLVLVFRCFCLWDAYLLHLPKRPFNASLLREWQLHRETSNGMPGLWMTHYADATCLLTGAKYPASAVAHGGTYVWKDGREHADTFYALVNYPEGFL